jgi:hypothetical protein
MPLLGLFALLSSDDALIDFAERPMPLVTDELARRRNDRFKLVYASSRRGPHILSKYPISIDY